MSLLRGWVAAGVVGFCAAAGCAQQVATPYTVKQEWVQADENYLASDALRGRGSGTKDELAAAQWVAKRFAEFGLTAAPGMKGYLQEAELSAPVLDGRAVLTVGGVKFLEGDDFTLLTAASKGVSGPLRIANSDMKAADARGAAVLFRPEAGMSSLASVGGFRRTAGLVLVPEDKSTEAMYKADGDQTRTGVGLKGEPPPRMGAPLVALKPEAANRIAAMVQAPGANVVLAVGLAPSKPPRYTYNAIGYFKGTDATAGTLLLTAHLDHLGVHTDSAGHEVVFHGANDDAAGTTAVIELARALTSGPKPKRSVLFVCYGSEEIGELGSTYFGEHPPVPLKDLVANLEFEMIGAQDPKMPKGVLLLTGWERSDLGPELKAHGALLGPDPYPEQHFFERSDNYALALDGVVAHTAAGWGTVPTYHQPTDDLAHLDVPFMTGAIQSLVGPVEWLVSSDFVPHWVAGGQPKR